MNHRIIPIEILDEFTKGQGTIIGAAESHNDVILRITFGQLWENLAKHIIWLNARGLNPTIQYLTADMLVDNETNVYDVPIPYEAKQYPGVVTMSVKGAETGTEIVDDEEVEVETRATLSAVTKFRVLESVYDPNAEESQDVIPTVAEQLQTQIDTIIETIADARTAAEEANESAESASESANSSSASASESSGYADESSAYANASLGYRNEASAYKTLAQQYRNISEAYAKGTVEGVEVESGEDGYHDNSKYYKELAEDAKDGALAAKNAIYGMTAEAETLNPGESATATFYQDTKVLTLGIPKGLKGDKGETGSPGADGVSAGIGNATASIDNNTGTPTVEVTTSGPNTEKIFNFNFHNLKGDKGNTGDKGDTGESAGFGTPIVSVNSNVGTPSATVTASGPDTAKVFAFQFNNLKGEQGVKGDTGEAAGFGTPTASIDNNTGTPSVTVTATGDDTEKVFDFAFHNLKGAKGDKGDDGTGVTILGSYDSYEELKAAHPTGELGDSYLIQGDLYIWSINDTDWINVGSIKGPKGDKGDTGNTGSAGNGISSVVLNSDYTLTIHFTNGTSTTTSSIRGAKGETGDTGATGSQGPAGPNSISSSTTTSFNGWLKGNGTNVTTATPSKTDIGLSNVDNVRQYSANNPPPYPVSSVAGKTGAVTLAKGDVGLGNVDNVKQYSVSNPPPYPVTKVANKTGDVTLGKSDVGLGDVDNVRQYSASNPPPYPVTSVNGDTGDVVLDKTDIGLSNVDNVKQYSASNPPPTDTSRQPKITTVSVSIAVGDWSNKEATKTVSGVSATETAQVIQIIPKLSSLTNFISAGILATAQASNSITFKCDTTPTATIDIYVAISEVI